MTLQTVCCTQWYACTKTALGTLTEVCTQGGQWRPHAMMQVMMLCCLGTGKPKQKPHSFTAAAMACQSCRSLCLRMHDPTPNLLCDLSNKMCRPAVGACLGHACAPWTGLNARIRKNRAGRSREQLQSSPAGVAVVWMQESRCVKVHTRKELGATEWQGPDIEGRRSWSGIGTERGRR